MKAAVDLSNLASVVMKEKGLQPEFSREEVEQVAQITKPAPPSPDMTDLRKLLWCSIDNDDSRDLDQLTYAEKNADQTTTIWIAIADVDALVKKDTPIDVHAQANTTSVYTPARIFPMLPEQLSTNLTSLNENEDRVAVVVKIQLDQSGSSVSSSIIQALVHNYAQLTYNNVAGWLAGKNTLHEKGARVPGLENALKLQHETAQQLKKRRHEAGSLTLQSSEAEVKVEANDHFVIELQANNFANQLIEEFMVAANKTMAEHLSQAKIANIRRVVRTPKFWDQIVETAREYHFDLPKEPDSKALDAFLIEQQAKDPLRFPDLSLTIIKLLGRGEYIVENDPTHPVGHFALALTDYTHSTAPNRRFPDLITQRQFKALISGTKAPYTLDELRKLAEHCSTQEDAATKVERQLNKSAAAMLLSTQIGAIFNGIVTGVNEKGTWVRILQPAVDGKIVQGFNQLKIGDKVSVQLRDVDIAKGFIDFVCLKKTP